jgi:hypothetical protein
MTAPSIRTLRPRVTRDQAVDAFSRGVVGVVRRLALGPLRSIADIYVPFRLYRVTIGHAARRQILVVGLESVAGILDLYRFDNVPEASEIAEVCTGNRVDAAISDAAARDRLAARIKRMTYQRVGFLAAGRFQLEIEPLDTLLHVPYWAGFFGRGDAASLVVMDAVRRQIEGAKAGRLIGDWLRLT